MSAAWRSISCMFDLCRLLLLLLFLLLLLLLPPTWSFIPNFHQPNILSSIVVFSHHLNLIQYTQVPEDFLHLTFPTAELPSPSVGLVLKQDAITAAQN